MKRNWFKAIGGGILGIVAALCLIWIFQGSEFFLYKFWAPKYEGVRREVFQETKSYVEGMNQELDAFYASYYKTGVSEEEKQALRSVVLHRVAGFNDESQLKPYLQEFVNKLRQERNSTQGGWK